jgi:ribonuclease-3
LRGLFAGAGVRPRPASLAEQEARVLDDFCRHYGLTFEDPTLLKLALTHRSYLHVSGQGPRESNERLEFLGDSVLGLVTSEYLYRAHPTEHEGQLTKTKSLLVSKAILSRRALAMGLGKFVLMSHSEIESGGRQRLSILADAFEAVVGAVYLDQGFEAARAFIEEWLLRESRVIAADKRHTNYKSHLQEYVQATFRTHPVYRIRSEMGPDHSKHFNVEVMVGKRVLGEGKGRNKKEAEQAAARDALERVEANNADRTRRRDARLPRASEDEGREVRSSRGIMEEPIEDFVAPAATIAPTPSRFVADVDEADDSEEGESRRRRGRRGGRGRKRPEGAPPPAEAEAPVAERPLVRPPSPPRYVRPVPPPDEPVEPVVQYEPLPRPGDEDEFDEVGRPEGPNDELHVDPYGWDAKAAEPEPETLEPELPREPYQATPRSESRRDMFGGSRPQQRRRREVEEEDRPRVVAGGRVGVEAEVEPVESEQEPETLDEVDEIETPPPPPKSSSPVGGTPEPPPPAFGRRSKRGGR